MQIAITLPWPPSVNVMWRTPRSGKLAGRTMLSAQGREYRLKVINRVMVTRTPRHTLKGKLSVSIQAYPPDRRARDLDNLLKGILDSLQHAGVIRSDADIDALHVVRGAVHPGGRIEVSVLEMRDELTNPIVQTKIDGLRLAPYA